MPPNRVLVVTMLGSLTAADIARFGFHTLTRPIAIGDIVRAALRAIGAAERPL